MSLLLKTPSGFQVSKPLAFPEIRQHHKLAMARQLAWLLDSAFVLPVVNKRVGMDFVLGLFPVVGDTAAFIASLFIIEMARQIGVPKKTLLVMFLNVLGDLLVGLVPVLGDTLDGLWKANLYNVKLMERHLGIKKQG